MSISVRSPQLVEPGNSTIMDSGNVSIGSVGSIPSTESPPPGYISEDGGDPMDQNDNMSESIVGIKLNNYTILHRKSEIFNFEY